MIKEKSIITQALSKTIEKALLYLTNPRIKEVVERRFGVKTGKPETLEAIGKGYGITRERVRQIQDVGLKILKSNEVLPLFDSIFKQIDKLFAQHGHISARNRAEKVVDFLINHFEKENQVFQEPDILNLLSQKHSDLPNKMFYVVLDISKEINKNIFNELGLSRWPDISPQGVKDRAYLVLKKQGRPLHFVNITELINQTFLDRPAYTQTVHNELIKDDRFVLAGRGTYALREWGYEPGTVEDIIERILRASKKPMTKKEVLDAVLAQRQVKPTTVVLNLQRSPKTQRLGDGRYALI